MQRESVNNVFSHQCFDKCSTFNCSVCGCILIPWISNGKGSIYKRTYTELKIPNHIWLWYKLIVHWTKFVLLMLWWIDVWHLGYHRCQRGHIWNLQYDLCLRTLSHLTRLLFLHVFYMYLCTYNIPRSSDIVKVMLIFNDNWLIMIFGLHATQNLILLSA